MASILGGNPMEQHNQNWLPHLSNEVVADARGWNLDAYVIALEGWRRGLTLKWHTKDSEKFPDMKTWYVDTPGRLFSLSSEDRTHYFFRTRGDKVTNEAVEIGGNKAKTKQALSQAGIRTPIGKRFDKQASDQEILSYGEKIGYPVVLKPTDGSFGRGVITNIRNEQELQAAITYLRHELNEPDVLLEQFSNGEDYRIYVVGDKAVAAMKRVPANVIGDGVSTISELIEQKNEIRKQNPRLISCLIKLDKEKQSFIKSQGYTLDTVLEKGKQLFLTNKSNISLGGDPINVTDEMPQEIMDYAVQALQAVPGLTHGSVDLIIDFEKSLSEAATVIELNPTSQIGGLLFPMQGKASDVPAAIIDYYFPETINLDIDRTKFYFDFSDVLSPLASNVATSSTVTPMPQGKVYAKKYTVIGDVQNLGYHMGLRKQAFERYLCGLVLNRSDGNIDVVVAGTDPDMVDDFKNGILEDPERSTVEEIYESTWSEPMKVGFEIKGDLKLQEAEIEQLIQQIETTEDELKIAEKQQKKLYTSFSWKISAPIRLVGSVIKKIRGEHP